MQKQERSPIGESFPAAFIATSEGFDQAFGVDTPETTLPSLSPTVEDALKEAENGLASKPNGIHTESTQQIIDTVIFKAIQSSKGTPAPLGEPTLFVGRNGEVNLIRPLKLKIEEKKVDETLL